MRKDQIEIFVDNSISKAYLEGRSSLEVIEFLKIKMANIRNVFIAQNPLIDIDNLIKSNDWENISNVRAKYTATYINHSYKRINDIKWMLDNKNKFRDYKEGKMFNLIKFKDKLKKPIKTDNF